MSFELAALAVRFTAAVRARDEEDAGAAYEALASRARAAGRDELTAGADALTPFLAEVRVGDGAMVANVAGDLLHLGADPAVPLPVLVERVATALELAAAFPAEWEKATGEQVPPSRDDHDHIPDVLALLPGVDAKRACEAWYCAGDWVPALLVPLQNKEIRQALPHRTRLSTAAAATAALIPEAHWLLGLSLVLDDEPILILHRASTRAFTGTISGIGDNFQLHTLLAAALLGRYLPGPAPAESWVAAATTGDPQPADGIRGQFNLVDAAGEWIWNEGRPVDIPPLDGRRVIVLDDPPYARTWTTGRVYPLMHPSLTVEAELPATEAAGWLARCPA